MIKRHLKFNIRGEIDLNLSLYSCVHVCIDINMDLDMDINMDLDIERYRLHINIAHLLIMHTYQCWKYKAWTESQSLIHNCSLLVLWAWENLDSKAMLNKEANPVYTQHILA